MLYVIYPDVDIWNYMLQDYVADAKDIVIRPLNRYCSKWQLVLRKLFNNSKVPSCLLFNTIMIEELKSLGEGDSVLICDYADPVLTKAVNALVSKKVKKHFWIWNPVTDKDRSFYSNGFKVMHSLGYHLATFDENDAKEYGMDCYNQFFRMENSVGQESIYDFYFIGFAKNREKDLLDLKEQLKDYSLLFKIVHSYAECISYEESIKNILQSKCIVEYVQHNQSGMTLRPLEALCYEKKLITNNQNTKSFDFYRPENIFILGEDKMEDLPNFLCTPYHHLPEEVVCKYDVSAWFNHFI